MNKPRHPQVIRPWIERRQKSGSPGSGKLQVQHTHEGKKHTELFRFKTPA